MTTTEATAYNCVRRGIARTRAELARVMGVSRPTASAVTETLLASGLVREGGKCSSSGGRSPTLLIPCAEAFSLIGIDLGAAGRIFGVRVRDPREAARKRLDDIETFPLDERWVLPARFTRTAEQASDYPTVERGVFEEQRVIGTVTFTLDGTEHTLLVAGRPDDDTGIERGNAHFTDTTSGKETYGNGRLVRIPDTERDGDTVVDLNRAFSFPCAFTNFVTCPLAPAQNRLPVAVTAGEKKPPLQIDRIQTFAQAS